MTTLKSVHDEMLRFNAYAAPGSECNAWQDFVADSFKEYGVGPWSDAAHDIEVSRAFAVYWTDVALGVAGPYDENGGRVAA